MPHNVAYFLSQQAAEHPHGAAVRAPVGRDKEGDIRVESRKAEADCRDNESRVF